MFPIDDSSRRSIPAETDAWDEAPVGLAIVDGRARILRINRVGAQLLGPGAAEVGVVGPFEIGDPDASVGEKSERERVATWMAGLGGHRELAYRIRERGGHYLIAFRDVTVRRRQERRAAAVASTAARVASEPSLKVTLSALADEVLQTDGLAGVQILAVDHSDDELRVMGSAGFPQSQEFLRLLMECKARGASLKMLDAFSTARHVVVHNRYEAVMRDPAWQPLHEILRHPEWNSFASLPLLVRGRSVGVLNIFFAPGQVVGLPDLEFLTTMAEQAAMAIDYAALLRRERHTARRAERQRLARELHDSVVQQVFSIGMQTEALKILAARQDRVPVDSVTAVVGELEQLAHTALRDLRSLVTQLHPPIATGEGLGAALESLADNTRRRNDLEVRLRIGPAVVDVGTELAEDVYFIVAEAVHNAVKHSGARALDIALDFDDPGGSVLHVLIEDDGCGYIAAEVGERSESGGYGMVSMRERVDGWGGELIIDTNGESGGTVVHAAIPTVTEPATVVVR
ncbi:GAF domain-containing sensor histidine kinase [Prescottella agglutinans]|uniref:Signal transduction histidine kinase n=1 Tax=Prescottella agglutinans TaxID=1644129 RepID=A0ABT6M8Y3_9NOCA|nr:GAF domain-containing sensor histidine kinase [Prescottella agglutinans]MDH6280774.1 signal transduction histidine kinase [Prescottella agglutinans]